MTTTIQPRQPEGACPVCGTNAHVGARMVHGHESVRCSFPGRTNSQLSHANRGRHKSMSASLAPTQHHVAWVSTAAPSQTD
jgi:hypothetical protein